MFYSLQMIKAACQTIADPRIRRVQTQLAVLADLRAVGMERVEGLNTALGQVCRNLVETFLRYARAIRFIVTFELRIEETLEVLEAEIEGSAAPAPLRAREAVGEDRSGPVRAAREDREESAAEAAEEDPLVQANLDLHEHERLRESENFEPLLRLPFADAVRWICQELDVDPAPYLRRLGIFRRGRKAPPCRAEAGIDIPSARQAVERFEQRFLKDPRNGASRLPFTAAQPRAYRFAAPAPGAVASDPDPPRS